MEPWDGPASIAFTDGTRDRRGARPQRPAARRATTSRRTTWSIMASEVGVLDIPAEDIVVKERLAAGPDVPGRHRAGPDHLATTRSRTSSPREQPYAEWLKQHLIPIEAVPPAPVPARARTTRPCCGASRRSATRCEDIRYILEPMARDGEEPIGSMGTDTPLAVLSDRAAAALRLLQAAVRAGHQPAARRHPRGAGHVDGDRRSAPERNLLRAGAGELPARSAPVSRSSTTTSSPSCAHIRLHGLQRGHAADAVPGRGRRRRASSAALEELNTQAAEAVTAGYTILILSDRGVERGVRADPQPAGDGRRAPPPGPPGGAHAVRAGRRVRRRARGAPLRAAHGLRRRRGQPVPGVRDASTT